MILSNSEGLEKKIIYLKIKRIELSFMVIHDNTAKR